MINHPLTFKEKDLEIDFNWNKSVTPCKKVRIRLGKKEVILSRDKFTTLMAIFADDQQMEDLMPVTKIDFVSIERMLKLKAKKDIKKGEYLTFPYTYWIPKTDYEQLKKDGEMVNMVKKDKKKLINFVSENEAAKSIKQMWEQGKLVV